MSAQSTTYRVPISDFELADSNRGLAPDAVANGEVKWTPAIVPGGVHESLLAAGLIEHPYFDQNEASVRWMEDRDWWYRTTFATPDDLRPGDAVSLLFHGLDTVVDIWLNGALLGHHENMFRAAEYRIDGQLEASNTLVLRFSPPLAGLTTSQPAVAQLRRVAGALMPDLPEDLDVTALGPSRELTIASQRRKAMFSWGWDFGPRVPSIGIWRGVEVVVTRRARIVGHHVRTDAIDPADATAEVTVAVEVDITRPGHALTAQIELTSPTGQKNRLTVPVSGGEAVGRLTISDVDLWWTHDLGQPSLYDVRIQIFDGDELCDALSDRVGIRTIALNRSAGPDGQRLFQFVLNEVPVFARGANWLPASTMVGSIPADRYRELVGLARAGGMNMLRVWGGGIYESDAFYAEADVNGVLIWQDFMFACADYESENPELQREVESEAHHQVRRLRNRACIALWCGNNEVQLLHGFAYQQYEPGNWGWQIFHRILPDAVSRWDPTATYWPGSPWGEDTPEGFMAVNGVLDGDRHAWEVWHGFDAGAGGGVDYASVGEARHFRRYARDRGRFISEFGIHSSPALSTLARWIPASELSVHSSSFDAHNKDHPKDKGDALLEIVTGLPQTIEQYVDFTMVSQAEGMKFGIEHYRRRQPNCSGTLVWQFNDVWPGITWSLIDYDTVPKAAYYASARAYAPVIASFVHQDGVLSLWVSNSGLNAVVTVATVSVGGFDGSVMLEEQLPLTIEAATSRAVWSVPLRANPELYAWVSSDNDAFPANRLFFGDVKDLPLPASDLRSTVTITGDTTAEVAVESSAFTYLTRVTSPHPGARFSENYFDLPPHTVRTIRVSGLPHGFEPQDLVVGSYVGSVR
ncbi:glycoside hydrolase family 2 protein [Microbacterium sp. LWS13-1.2]|uniref:beta-mannosidase n=1 Tax=Microbacterium sp. LWS13-1.2 TaxID=3135264 RepID=A0AAU6SE58_9MICO